MDYRFAERPTSPQGKTSSAATALGILSIVTCFTFPVFIPGLLASIAIVLALISRGADRALSVSAKRAITYAVIGIVVNVVIFGNIAFTLYRVIQDPEYRKSFDQTMEGMYGFSLSQFLRDFDSTYGTDLFEDSGSSPVSPEGFDTATVSSKGRVSKEVSL